MSATRAGKTSKISSGGYKIYLGKAKEFYQTMYSAEKQENWNAVGLNGVHCVIALIDALLVKYSGLRSADENHLATIDLLTSTATSRLNDIRSKSQLAKRVIAQKTRAAYEDRNFSPGEARDMVKRVERFYRWALSHLEA